MLELIIAALMTLGVISSPEQATQDVINANRAQVHCIINPDTDEI